MKNAKIIIIWISVSVLFLMDCSLLSAQIKIKSDCLSLIDNNLPIEDTKLKRELTKLGKQEVESNIIKAQEFWDLRVLPFWSDLNGQNSKMKEIYRCYIRSAAINLAGFVFFKKNNTDVNFSDQLERIFHASVYSPLHSEHIQETKKNQKVLLVEARAWSYEANHKELAEKRGDVVKNFFVSKGISPERIKIRVFYSDNFEIDEDIAFHYQNNSCNLKKYYTRDPKEVNRSVLVYIY